MTAGDAVRASHRIPSGAADATVFRETLRCVHPDRRLSLSNPI